MFFLLLELLSIPPKQFLQILSQVQVTTLLYFIFLLPDYCHYKDLYKTAQSFESDDQENLIKLYNYVQKCKLFGVCIHLHKNNLLYYLFHSYASNIE